MPSDLIIDVRQISSYPNLPASNGTETLLLQQGGLGGPYASISSAALVSTALNQAGPIGIGVTPPQSNETQVFSNNFVTAPEGGILFNLYWTGTTAAAWRSGYCGGFALNQATGTFEWELGSGQAGQAATLSGQMALTMAGNLSLPHGTLAVARDPAAAGEVVTLSYLANNTVHSFNARNGQVILNAQDVYAALQLCDPIATQPWVNNAITNAIQNLLYTCPFVNQWNHRTGSVYLMLSDITTVFYQPGQQPISPTPPPTSNDDSIATTAWVTNLLSSEGTGNFATQPWVLANTVNSFNNRRGVVTLTTADITAAGGAPILNPALSGLPTAPTAPVGTSTGQLATTAFVQAALAASVAGVASFNTRTGVVTLTTADLTTAGGAPIASPTFTGTPAAPTAAPGTSTTQLATTGFVQAALAAGVTSFNTRTGAVTFTTADLTSVGGAPINNPTFTGVPAAPTATAGTNTTQLATTAFVAAAIGSLGAVTSFNSRTGAITLQANDVSAAGGLINPSVALTGTPTAPTAAAATNTTQIATTAFTQAAITAGTAAYMPISGGHFTGPLTSTTSGSLPATPENTPNLSFVSGRIISFRQLSNATSPLPTYGGVNVYYNNLASTWPNLPWGGDAGASALAVNANAFPGSNGSTVALQINLTSQGAHAYTSQDVGGSFSVTKLGQNSTWALSTQTQDNTGLAPGSFASVGAEIDILANGPDNPVSMYDYHLANRYLLYLAFKVNPTTTYAASTNFGVGTIVVRTPSGGVATCYICTTAGTTGASAPTWPASGTVTDGTVVWTTGTTNAASIGTGVYIGADKTTPVTMNTGIGIDAQINNACIDLTRSTMTDSTCAGLRLADGMPIDFTGNGTNAGKNQRILQYSDYWGGLVYQNSTTNVAMLWGNDGSITAGGRQNLAGGASDISGVTTGYSNTGLTIGRNRTTFGETDLIVGPPGINFYSTDGSGNVSTPFVQCNTSRVIVPSLVVGSNQVVGARIAGWGTSTGGARGAVSAASATLPQVAAALAQLLTDLKTHGLLGA